MFKLFHRPGELDAEKENLIAEAANRLDVGEFQLFQLSYESWYGRDPEPRVIEPYFFAYLFHDRLPTWARHYARNIVRLDDGGGLRSQNPEYHRFDPPYEAPAKWIGWSVLLATFGVVAAFIVLMSLASSELPTTNCVFPPCM